MDIRDAVFSEKAVAGEISEKQPNATSDVITDKEKTFLSEWHAHMSEELLGEDKDFARRLVRGDVTLAEKVLNGIAEMKRALKSMQSAEERQRYQRLRRAEKMYLEVIAEAGMTYRGGKIRYDTSDSQLSRKSAGLNDKQKRTQTEFQASGIQVPLGGTEFGFTSSVAQTDENVNTDVQFSSIKGKPFSEVFQPEAKAASLLRSTGFQIPVELNESGFTDSISQTDENVNTDPQFSRKPSAQATIQSQERKLARRDGRIAKQKEKLAEQKAVLHEQEKQLRRWERGAARVDLVQSRKKIAEDARRILSLKSNGYLREAGQNAERFTAAWRVLAESGAKQDPAEVRSRLKKLGEWYASPANRYYHNRGIPTEDFKADIAARLARIGEGKGTLGTEEWRALAAVTGYFHAEIAHRDQVLVKGQWQDAAREAERFFAVHQKNRNGKTGAIASLGRSGYIRTFGDPLSVVRAADQYDANGIFTQTFRRLEEGECGARIAGMEITEARRTFLQSHKKYIRHMTEDTVTYGGQELTVAEGMYLCLLHRRKDTWQTLVRTGLAVEDTKGNRRLLPPLDPHRQQAYPDRAADWQPLITASEQALLAQFTAEDRQFLALAEAEMQACSALKEKTDLLLDGYTNVKEDYYIPTYRTDAAKKLADVGYRGEVNSITDPGFNRSVSGSTERLLLRPLTDVLDRHVSGICLYANLSLPIRNFNRMLNAELAERGAPSRSLRSLLELSGQDKKALRFLQQMTSDLEGKGDGGNSAFNRMIHRLRSNYATAVLGVNPGTLLSQTSSYLAAGNLLSYRSLALGFSQKASGEDVDTYCPLAKLRNTERTVVKARTVTDSVSRMGEAMMKGISVTDRLIVQRLFAACKVEVQRKQGLTIGTEENNRAAGTLLTEILLRTQQNSLTTGRSDAMRSSQELLRSVTMFTSDAMKQNGRLLDALGALSADRANLKEPNLSAEEKAERQSRLQQDRKQAARSGATLLANSVYLSAIALLMQGLYGRLRDKEPEEAAWEVAVDVVGNTLGGLPLIRDIYSLFTEGYELDTFSVSMVNDVLNAAKSVLDLCGDALSGKEVSSHRVAAGLRRLTYGVSHLFGLPARNVYKVTAGVLGTVSPAAGYRLESLFEEKSYRSDLKRALESGDDAMIAAIAGRLLDEEIGGENAAVRAAMRRLMSQGYTNIFPRSVGDTVTYRGKTITLTAAQKERFAEQYRNASERLARLVSLSAYRQADAATQAKIIRFLYDLYDQLACEICLGAEDGKLSLFVRAMDAERLALAVCVAKEMSADTDAFGRSIPGSRKEKIIRYLESLRLPAAQKHIILGYLGYRQSAGKEKVSRYLQTLSLDSTEQRALLYHCGYAA